MTAQNIHQSYPIFNDINGQPLENGNIYIGTAGLTAEDNQINVYWDLALTSLVTQPIRTKGGYLSNANVISNVYVGAADYSITVKDKNGTLTSPVVLNKVANVGLQEAYNVAEAIVTNATNGSVDVQVGSGADTDSALTVKNIAGTIVANVRGDNKVGFGMGATTPKGTVHIRTADSGVTTPNASGTDLIVEGSGNMGVSILSGAASSGSIYFGSTGGASKGIISYDQSADTLSVSSGSSITMTLDASQNVGIGESTPGGRLHVKTGDAGAITPSTSGDELVVEGSGNAGVSILAGVAASSSLYFASTNDPARGVVSYDHSADQLSISTTATISAFVKTTEISPGVDNTSTAGSGSFRYTELFSVNATINTSDEREKTVLEPDDAVLDVIDTIGIVSFKWNDAIEKKGIDDARIHYGVLAQDLKRAFEAASLDPSKYSVFCYDEWEETIDSEGNVLGEAGNRYGVRYEELYALKIACLDRRIKALESA
jgi:hypothetical protein